MKVSLANKNIKVVVANKNNLGRVTFSKIAKVGAIQLASLTDVNTAGQQDGDILVYNANTNTYIVQTLPRVDGGAF
jgi:hypothetical protein